MLMLSNFDLNGNQLLNTVIQNLATAPASPKKGQVYFNTATNRMMQYNGTIWVGMDGADATFTLPVATAGALGGVKSGTDITVDASGNVSVNDNSHAHTIANVTGLQTALDAKETPAGAQAKADTALNSAKSYADTAVANIIASAPDLMNTLNELATALGNDPNFATTMTNQLALRTKKYSVSIGDGTATSIVVTHNLNTQNAVVSIRQTASPYSEVLTDVAYTSANTITVAFATAPKTGQYTVTVVG